MNEHIRERDVEKYLVKQARAHGGECRKVQWIGRRNAPDRVLFMPNVTLWIELKKPGERATPTQIAEHRAMRAMGQSVFVVDSHEGVDALFA